MYYELDGKKYDVTKLSSEAQALFGLLVASKEEAVKLQKLLTVHTESYTSFATKLNELLNDEALVTEQSDTGQIITLILDEFNYGVY